MKFTSAQLVSIDIISRYIEGDILLDDALAVLGVKERQFRRKVKAFKESGVQSVLHGNVGKKPINKVSDKLARQICNLYKLKYFDLSIAHFIEKLIELEGFEKLPSYTTIRNILIEKKLLTLKTKRSRKAYKRRKRYGQEGLMIQIDGSPHRWISGHLPICLTAAIDDATGKIVGAKFSKTETTFAAMDVVEQILKKYGIFQMLYSDKAGIYGGGKRQGYSNMERAMKEIGVISVQANSPQAKGRVERLFGTLQNRLVQEIRLAGIKTIEEANVFLESYLPIYNDKFGREAENRNSAYKVLDEDLDLNEVLCMKVMRVVKNGNIINLDGFQYVIHSDEYLVKKYVEVRYYRNNDKGFFIDGEKIEVSILDDKKMAA
ncbi:MAG: ISNCY family transposase [Flavobacteriaceae bacterium]|nr:ISNCY family transposase [Flavobacteriaceae bacterium]